MQGRDFLMECPVCRTSNTSGIKYCIKCGRNLESFQEVDYGRIDRGGYHTEEEYLSENNGFEMSDGVFTVNDKPSSYMSPDLFISEELNNTIEEYDFGGQPETVAFEEYDSGDQSGTVAFEEYDSGYQSGTVALEEYDSGDQFGTVALEEYDFIDQSGTVDFEEHDFGGYTENVVSDNSISFNEEPLKSQPYTEYKDNSLPLPAPPYSDMYGNASQIAGYDQNNMPVYVQPQFIGYDQNGTPVYAQMQFIGYDQNGMPMYAQSQVYPQFMGYDQNGMPVYAQPQTYPQPQFMGYDQNGMPVYAENPAPVQSMPQSVPSDVQKNDDTAEKFMDFLDDGENKSTEKTREDFFGKSSDMGDVDLPVMDVGSLRKREQKKKVYMTDVEIQDAENLIPNTAAKFSQKYMRQAENVNSNDLGEKNTYSRKVSMGSTKSVDAEMLNPKMSYKSRIRMGDATNANPDMSQNTVKKRKAFTMEEAGHAVEAMPKKKQYVDELDLIEIPEYMQARKKSKKDKKNFPSMTDL